MNRILNKVLPAVTIAALLVFVMSVSAFAELVPSRDDWAVSFTADKKMNSNFKKGEIEDQVYGLQPGDYTDIVLNIKNDNDNTTDWYMTNEVIKSLEETRSDDNGLSGGAYTYILTYNGNGSGSGEKVLFSSDRVGGEGVNEAGEEGLHQATDALKDWVYLDTLKKGEGGKLTLRVALDGETQGNDYQDTLAQLQMNFAVELTEPPKENPDEKKPTKEEEEDKKKSTKEDDEDKKKSTTNEETINKKSSTSSNSGKEVVRTGDDTNSTPLLIAAGISGLVLLLLAIYSLRERQKQRGGKA